MTAGSRPKPSSGIYDRRYWDFAAAGELRLQRCRACEWIRYPPAAVCPRCLSSDCDWTRLSGRGCVLAWTLFHRQYFSELPPPYTVVCVKAHEGPTLIGNLVNAESADLRVGLEVRATFEVVQSNDGDWRICQWEPAVAGAKEVSRRAHA